MIAIEAIVAFIMSTLKKINLKDNRESILFATEDFIFSIVFCKQTNGIFYSNFSNNNISLYSLNENKSILYKEDNVVRPKSVCLDKNHERVFYEDDNGGISGFHAIYHSVFSWASYSSIREIQPLQNSRNIISTELHELINKVNCIEYIDDLNIVLVLKNYKNSIDCIYSSGRIGKFMGNSKPDFCLSNNLLNISLNSPSSLHMSYYNNELLVSDSGNHVIRRFSKNNNWKELGLIGIPTKMGEQDGKCDACTFTFPSEICNFNENIFVIDNYKRIRHINIDKREVKTIYSTTNFIKSITCDHENIYWTEF